MKLKQSLIAILIGVSFLIGGHSVLAQEVPKPTNYIVDQAGVIDDQVEAKLNAELKQFSDSGKGEIAVLTIKTIKPYTIEQFGIKLGDTWKVGKKGDDSGAILIIVTEDRKVRIEVGKGTEALITDSQAGGILDKNIVPYLKDNKWTEATENGVHAIMVKMGSDPTQVATASATTEEGVGTGFIVFIVILGVIFIICIAASPYTPIGGQGTYGITSLYSSSGGSWFSSGSSSGGSSGGGFGGFGGGGFGGGGASRGF